MKIFAEMCFLVLLSQNLSRSQRFASACFTFQCHLFIHLLRKGSFRSPPHIHPKQISSRFMCIPRHLTWPDVVLHSIFFQLVRNYNRKSPVNLLRNSKTWPRVWQEHEGRRSCRDQFPLVDAPFPIHSKRSVANQLLKMNKYLHQRRIINATPLRGNDLRSSAAYCFATWFDCQWIVDMFRAPLYIHV